MENAKAEYEAAFGDFREYVRGTTLADGVVVFPSPFEIPVGGVVRYSKAKHEVVFAFNYITDDKPIEFEKVSIQGVKVFIGKKTGRLMEVHLILDEIPEERTIEITLKQMKVAFAAKSLRDKANFKIARRSIETDGAPVLKKEAERWDSSLLEAVST